jgi:hypothetical protein
LLQTRVLSIFQEIKDNLAVNVPTVGIYIDDRKPYDMVWHRGLIVKLARMRIPPELLKIIISWLKNGKARGIFGNYKSDSFK